MFQSVDSLDSLNLDSVIRESINSLANNLASEDPFGHANCTFSSVVARS